LTGTLINALWKWRSRLVIGRQGDVVVFKGNVKPNSPDGLKVRGLQEKVQYISILKLERRARTVFDLLGKRTDQEATSTVYLPLAAHTRKPIGQRQQSSQLSAGA
jgi:hypothetical protein